MKKAIFLLCASAVLALAIVGCNGNITDANVSYPQSVLFKEVPVMEPSFPEASFSEYSLTEYPCRWRERQSYLGSSAVLVIDSEEELKNYVECRGEGYPDIDFSKKTLLLAHGAEGNLVTPNSTRFQKRAARDYAMEVNLLPSLATVPTLWQVPIVVDKIATGDAVELTVTQIPEPSLPSSPQEEGDPLPPPTCGGDGTRGGVVTYSFAALVWPDSDTDAGEIGGNVTANPHQRCYDAGTQVTVVAKANDGYDFVGWSEGHVYWLGNELQRGSIISTDTSLSITINREQQIVTANFRASDAQTCSPLCGGSGSDDTKSLKNTAKNTTWKLSSFVDFEKNLSREPDLNICANPCYTLEFLTDSTYDYVSSTNHGWGTYSVDYVTSKINITSTGGTKINESEDGWIWHDIFASSLIETFTQKEGELILYYNEGKNGLIFKPL